MKTWPALRSYEEEFRRKVALPLGGLGTGTVSLGGRGELRDWEIMNTPAKGFIPVLPSLKNLGPFFALHCESAGKKFTRLLEGPLDLDYDGAEGALVANSGLPRFEKSIFHTAYPLAEIELHDSACPLEVRLKAFNPLVPGDAPSSSLPCAMLHYELHNPTQQEIIASICGTLVNHIGCDGREQKRAWGGRVDYLGAKGNVNTFMKEKSFSGLNFTSTGVEPFSEAAGTMALVAYGGESAGYRTSWESLSWGDSLLDFWDEFSMTGRLTDRKGEGIFAQLGSLAQKTRILPGQTKRLSFLLTWHFPNRRTWTPDADLSNKDNLIGNHYTTLQKDAWQWAKTIYPQLPRLEEQTVSFVNAFVHSALPHEVKEAALFNASTLRSQTCFQTPDGHFFGWEGVHDFEGSCHGSCTHVWNYEQTLPFLFSSLAQSMRSVEFLHMTNPDGLMRFRTQLPLEKNQKIPGSLAAADGQMGTLMKLYREWTLCGELAFLKTHWPKAKKVLEFAWLPLSWDANQDGVMEGCQHNTMDVEYYGPNPQMQTWYLGALRAMALMAEAVGDQDFAKLCQNLFERGSEWTDQHLFNGEYYEHQIIPSTECYPGLRTTTGSKNLLDPDLQLGKGCLIDQLVGQMMAHVCGLGYLLKKENVQTTLKSVVKYNYKNSFHDHFNHMRSYALGDERAILMATYPLGQRPKRPFPYFNEVMTGFEHTLAVHLIYEGLEKEGLKIIQDIRHRYDGKKRNPLSEAECGHHYARAMVAWAGILAINGFQYNAATKKLEVSEQPTPMFFSTGRCWGTWKTFRVGQYLEVELCVEFGEIDVQKVMIKGKEVQFRSI